MRGEVRRSHIRALLDEARAHGDQQTVADARAALDRDDPDAWGRCVSVILSARDADTDREE